MLLVLVDFVYHVGAHSRPDLVEATILSFDVNDLASFIGSVRSTSLFLTRLEFSSSSGHSTRYSCSRRTEIGRL